MGTYKILTFDGGGILGVVGLKLLERLNRKLDGAVLDGVDMFAGTSIGSMTAASLAIGVKPWELLLLYETNAIKALFLPYPGKPEERGVTKPLYFNPLSWVEEHLVKFLGDARVPLSKLDKRLLMVSLQLENQQTGSWQPVFFNNFPDSPTADAPLLQTVLRSSSAPVFYPTFEGFIDGWTVANNPCTAALSTALDATLGNQQLDDIRIMSFGIGNPTQSISGAELNWGSQQWLGQTEQPSLMTSPPLLGLLLSQSSTVNTMYCQNILGSDRFLRLNPALDSVVRIDDDKAIDDLIKQVKEVDLDPYIEWIQKNWM